MAHGNTPVHVFWFADPTSNFTLLQRFGHKQRSAGIGDVNRLGKPERTIDTSSRFVVFQDLQGELAATGRPGFRFDVFQQQTSETVPSHFGHDINIVDIEQGFCRERGKASKTYGNTDRPFVAQGKKNQGGRMIAKSIYEVFANVCCKRFTITHGIRGVGVYIGTNP